MSGKDHRLPLIPPTLAGSRDKALEEAQKIKRFLEYVTGDVSVELSSDAKNGWMALSRFTDEPFLG